MMIVESRDLDQHNQKRHHLLKLSHGHECRWRLARTVKLLFRAEIGVEEHFAVLIGTQQIVTHLL